MPVKKEVLLQALEKAFPNSDINIKALVEDDDHWEVTVKSGLFWDKSRVEQHRLVTGAVKELNIHALSIRTTSA